MFNNIGDKLKGIACLYFVLGLIGSILGGIGLLLINPIVGIAVAIAGIVSTLPITWLFYGVGEAIINTEAIQKELKAMKGESTKIEYKRSDDPIEDAANQWKARQAAKWSTSVSFHDFNDYEHSDDPVVDSMNKQKAYQKAKDEGRIK